MALGKGLKGVEVGGGKKQSFSVLKHRPKVVVDYDSDSDSYNIAKHI